MTQYLILALLKIFDSLLATSKSILVHKNKAFAASCMVFLSQLSYMIIMVKVIQANNTMSIFIVAISASVGSLFAFLINNKLSKDRTYINIVTCNNKESVRELVEYLQNRKIKNIVTLCADKNGEFVNLCVQIFATTRNQSKIIDDFIDNSDVKYLRQIVD